MQSIVPLPVKRVFTSIFRANIAVKPQTHAARITEIIIFAVVHFLLLIQKGGGYGPVKP
jgi:hypothetical protein